MPSIIRVVFYNNHEKVIEKIPNTYIEAPDGHAVAVWLRSKEEDQPLIRQINALFPDTEEIWVEVPPFYLNKYRIMVELDWSGHPDSNHPKYGTTVDRKLIWDWLRNGAPLRWGF